MNVHAARLTTRVLAGLCGALLLLAILQYAGLGSGFSWSDASSEASDVALGEIDQQPIQLPPASAFADIAAHPLFNADRQPTPLDAAEAGADGDEPPPSPLNVALTGVILDARNNVSIAMLQDKSTNQAIALKVGMPLEGEQASWTLVEVRPRGAVFRSAADETTEVELETAVAVSPRPAPARNRQPPAKTNARGTAIGTNANSDLAKRIEERRRQMREDADRMRKEAASGKSEPAK